MVRSFLWGTLTVCACSSSGHKAVDGPGGGGASGHVVAINGASPGAGPHGFARIAPASSADGNWWITPNKLTVPITGLQLIPQGEAGGPVIPLSNCAVTFDVTKPGLAQGVSCPFTVPAGTYGGAGAQYGATYDILIDDPVNGIYTDPSAPSKLSLTAPAGGAQTITVPNPIINMGDIAITRFAQPLVINDGDTVSVSMVIEGLQSLQININGTAVTWLGGGSGPAGWPSIVTAVGTPAAVGYYVNSALGTPYSYNETTLGPSYPYAIGVQYSNSGGAAFLTMSRPDLPNCGPTQVLFVFPGKGNGYLGLDANGVLGWASFSDPQGTAYSAVMKMAQVSTVSATTMFDCMSTTTDPMPPGDSFASGAPTITTPTHTETMMLVAK